MNIKTKDIRKALLFVLAVVLMLIAIIPVIWFVLVSFQPKDVAPLQNRAFSDIKLC